MKTRTLTGLLVLVGGLAAVSLAVFAGSDPLKSASSSGSSATATQDSMGNPKSPSSGQGSMGTAPSSRGSTGKGGTGSEGAAGSASAQPAMTLSDGQILEVVNTVDDFEVDAASKAMKKKIGKEAREYAKMLKEQHSADQAAVKKLSKTADIKLMDSKTSDDLKAKGKEDLKNMSAQNGSEFEKAYIDAMVNGHQEVLNMIDSQLLPNAKNTSVSSHLSDLRTHVSAHLEQGKRLQGSRASREE
jgi:putative membrane protein